jgi:alkanesulfonate monooxygenase SsuD/methylene tetrahydromethanopterin reductase-like flavin-dependent oxidoreductase (luciferase family)
MAQFPPNDDLKPPNNMPKGRSMTDRQARVSMYNGNTLKLGLFGANCSNGRAMTTAPERWLADWDSCEKLAELSDEVGIDFLLPIGRWKGYNGATDHQGSTLESVTWACGLLARTKRITVFATVHAPLINPVMAAKEFVTADLIGRGRFALNVVIGWNETEFKMFGIEKRAEHSERYEYGQEWLDAIKRMWGPEEEFDFIGKHLDLRGLRLKPKPYGGTAPLIMNAGVSPTGRDYALRNCDALFSAKRYADLGEAAKEVVELKTAGRAMGRDIGLYTVGEVVCRPTRKEAEDYFHYWTEEAVDWGAVDYMLSLKGVKREADPVRYDTMRKALVHGQSGITMVGTPDDVADELARISAAGFEGIGFSFLNYLAELPYFAQEVLPRLHRKGLRESAPGLPA